MPAAATLNSGVSTLAFTVPVGARGFVVWNNSATELRLRINAKAAASGTDEGIPIAAGDSGTVFYTHGFSQPLKEWTINPEIGGSTSTKPPAAPLPPASAGTKPISDFPPCSSEPLESM